MSERDSSPRLAGNAPVSNDLRDIAQALREFIDHSAVGTIRHDQLVHGLALIIADLNVATAKAQMLENCCRETMERI